MIRKVYWIVLFNCFANFNYSFLLKAFTICGFVFNNELLHALCHLNKNLKGKLCILDDWDKEFENVNKINGKRDDFLLWTYYFNIIDKFLFW